MFTCFNAKTDVAQNIIDDFFSNFDCQILSEKKHGGTGLISEKKEILFAELNGRVETATGTYSVTGDSLQYIYSVVPVTKNHRNIQSRCLVHEFSFTYVFLTILIMLTRQLY